MKSTFIIASVSVFLAVAAQVSFSNTVIDFQVTGTTVYTGDADGNGVLDYGGCMAQVTSDNPISSSVAGCIDGYVTFDCAGATVQRSSANAAFAQAQLAQVSNRLLKVYVTPSTIDGFCIGTWVSVRGENAPAP